MNIGILKERKKDENRVALQPFQVKELKNMGHEIFFETEAGLNSGFYDKEYSDSGAVVCSKNEVFEKAELILKIKAPLRSELADYKPNHVLFAYLHFDENMLPSDIRSIVSTGITAIAYEWVEVNGKYPLLEPMSCLTGYLFAQKSVELCSKYKGKLCGCYEKNMNVPGKMMIIGIGNIGQSAFNYAVHNNLQLIVVDKNPHTVNDRLNKRFDTEKLDYLSVYSVKVIKFDNGNQEKVIKEIADELPETDIVLCCAVRRPDLPKSAMEYLITKEMVATMKKGSVVADATACDRDLIETCVSSELLDYYDDIDGIIHYGCDHIPSYVGRTATELLTDRTFEYVKLIAQNGIAEAIKSNDGLRKGVMCAKGRLTHKYSAEKKGIPYVSIEEVL